MRLVGLAAQVLLTLVFLLCSPVAAGMTENPNNGHSLYNPNAHLNTSRVHQHHHR